MLAFLANSLHSLAEKFDEYNELLSSSTNPNEELDASRYQLLYLFTLIQNKQQQKVFVKENTALLTKYQKTVEDLETSNIIIKTQGHTIQEKNRLIEDMEVRLRDREDKIRKQIEEKAQLRLRLEEARNDGHALQDKLSTSDRLLQKHYKDAEFYKKELNKAKAELNNTKGLLDTYITMCTNLGRKNDENYAEYAKEITLYKIAYPDIMLLPEGVKCPWEDANMVSSNNYTINGRSYTLWGRGFLRNTGCNTQIRGRSEI